MELLKRFWAEIDLDNLKNNYDEIKKTLNKTNQKMIAVVKADAYGHGDYYICKELEKYGVDFFAVSNISEAITLKNKGINSKILIFGKTPQELLKYVCDNGFYQTVFNITYAEQLQDYCEKNGCEINVHIKIDTGMSRMGFIYNSKKIQQEKGKFIEEIKKLHNYNKLNVDGIYTHFSHSDCLEQSAKDFTQFQYDNFKEAVECLTQQGFNFKTIHCQNSGAIESCNFNISTHSRPGIILYGLAPSDEYCDMLALKPLMSLKATITSVKSIEKGSYISYSRKFKASKDMKIAIVPAGYADGYLRSFYKQGYVLVNGKKAKITGVVCMDQFMVDVTDIDDVNIGDEVILMGESSSGECITADLMAHWADTINYEIVCAVSRRVPRVYIKDGEVIDTVSYL